MRYQVKIPVCKYTGYYPVLSNSLDDYQEQQFIRYGSVSEFLPFHCFVDDWRLESIWRSPSKAVERAILSRFAIAPDFSVYPGFPPVYSMYQIWRSRVICSYWQGHGVFSVPCLQWTHSKDPYLDKYFCGLENCDVVAVRCPTREPSVIEDYRICAERFLQVHQPKLVLHFGLTRGSDVWPNCKVIPLNPKQGKKRL